MRIKFKTVKQFIALSILMKSVIACSSDDLYAGGETRTNVTKGEVGTQETTDIFTDSTKNGAIVLDPAPVGNPYNVDTLKKAYTLLYPNDQVSDYPTAYVMSALRTATNLNQFKENIKVARYNSEADKVKIDTLFNRYIYYWNKYK